MDDGCRGARECLDAVKPHYDEARAAGKAVGLGLGLKNSGLGNGFIEISRSVVRFEEDGTVEVRHCWTEMGQGVHTVALQVAVEELGIDPARVRVVVDTTRELGAGQTTGSRGTLMASGSVADACKAALADGCRTGVDYPGEYRVDWTNHLGEPGVEHPIIHSAFGYAAQVAIVDRETGAVEKVVAAHDVGRAVNPLLCVGQIEGAVHMGLGYALTEDFPTDDDARPTAMTLRALNIIRAKDVPDDRDHPRRGAPAQRPLRREGRGRDRPRAHVGRGGRGPARARRRVAQPPADATRHGGRRRVTADAATPDDERTIASVVVELPPSVTPGLVCGHHHLYSALARGMPAPPRAATDFTQILDQVWWRLDAALDLEMIRWSAMLGAMEALERGTTAIVDHHESPNAIEGSLDVIAEACAEVGVQVSCCYEVTDRHGADGAARGLAENERFLRAGGRGIVGAHACLTCSDETLEAVVGLADDLGVGVHIHVAEDLTDVGAGARLAPFANDEWLLAHCVHLDRRLRGTIAHNPRSNMNNAVGYAHPADRPNPVVLGTDGIGADMLEEFRIAFAALRASDVTASPDTAWDWLAGGWALFPEALDDRVTWSYEPMSPWHLAYTPGVSPARGRRRRRDRVRRRRAHPGRPRRGAGPRRRAGRPPPRPPLTTPLPHHLSLEPTPMAVPVAIYLQDAHPIREGMEFAQYAEAKGFDAVWQAESRLVREATVPMAAFASGDRHHQGGLGRRRLLEPQPGPPRRHLLHPRRPGPRPGDPRHRRLVGPAGRQGRHQPGQARSAPCARSSPWCGRCCTTRRSPSTASYVHLDGVELDYVYQERRPKDVPIYIGATGMQMMELTGEIADGVVLNYLVSPDYNAQAMEHLAIGADRRPAARSTTSTGPSWWCARCTRTARPPSTWPA